MDKLNLLDQASYHKYILEDGKSETPISPMRDEERQMTVLSANTKPFPFCLKMDCTYLVDAYYVVEWFDFGEFYLGQENP